MRALHCRIAEYQQDKARKLEEVRNRQQYDELQDCTFAPAINSTRAPSRSRVHVRGVASHLEKHKLAKKKVEEAEQRKAEVFILNPKAPRAKYTIAKPFDLSLKKRVCPLSTALWNALVQAGKPRQECPRHGCCPPSTCVFAHQPFTGTVLSESSVLASLLQTSEQAYRGAG